MLEGNVHVGDIFHEIISSSFAQGTIQMLIRFRDRCMNKLSRVHASIRKNTEWIYAFYGFPG